MSYTSESCLQARDAFPALSRTINEYPVAFFDGPGGTQVPRTVLDAIEQSYIERNANFDGAFETSIKNTAATAGVRETVAEFLGAQEPNTISFGANMTSLNFSLSRAFSRYLTSGEEVMITALDHEANRGPWLTLEASGIAVKEIAMTERGELDYVDFENKLSPRTRLIAVGLASNALGTVNDIARIRALAGPDVLIVADAVHYAAHFPVDVRQLEVDMLLCSAYKFYGPHVGILYARPGLLDQLQPDHLLTQKGHAPYRIETGTLNYPAIAGVGAAIDFIAEWGSGENRREQLADAMGAIHDYEMGLAKRYYDGVAALPGVTLWGPGINQTPRTPTVSISFENDTPEDAARYLADRGLQVWHGHFYAKRVLECLGLADKGGLIRTGMSMYNTEPEVDRLLTGLEDFTRRR